MHWLIITIPYPRIPPDIFRIGPIALRWYGVMYVIGYAVGVWLARRRAKQGLVPLGAEAIDTLVGYLVIGMLLGGDYATTPSWLPPATRRVSYVSEARFPGV